jgi:hypothetical protein
MAYGHAVNVRFFLSQGHEVAISIANPIWNWILASRTRTMMAPAGQAPNSTRGAVAACHARLRFRILAVDITPVPDPHYQNDQLVIMNIIDHTIVTDPYAVSLFRSHELLATRWSRI